jgi:hypothetical protein
MRLGKACETTFSWRTDLALKVALDACLFWELILATKQDQTIKAFISVLV